MFFNSILVSYFTLHHLLQDPILLIDVSSMNEITPSHKNHH